MFQSIEIERFKGIEHLKLDGLKPVNLITGVNNIGKTSVLNAIDCLSGSIDPDKVILNIFNKELGEGEIQKNGYFLKKIFYDLNTHMPAFVKAVTYDDKIYELKLKLFNSKTGFITSSVNFASDIFGGSHVLIFNVEQSDSTKSFNSFYLIEDSYARHIEQLLNIELYEAPPLELGIANFISSSMENYRTQEISKYIDEVQFNKMLPDLIAFMHLADKKITDIKIGRNNTILFDIGLTSLIDFYSMGEGVQRLLRIMSVLFVKKNIESIVIIDEIDTGLHWTSLKVLWKIVYHCAKRFNIQVFTTTHSQECIDAAIKVQKEIGDDDYLSLYRLYRHKDTDELSVRHYDKNGLEAAYHLNRDLR